MTEKYDPWANLKKDIQINEADLDNAMIQHAALRSDYARLFEEALDQENRAKLRFEISEAKKDTAIRTKAVRDHTKLTEAMIVKVLAQDSELIKQKINILNLEKTTRLAKQALTDFDHRRDMIVQVSKHIIKDMDFKLRVTDKSAGVDPSKVQDIREQLKKHYSQ